MKPKFNWGGLDLLKSQKLREARKAAMKRHKKVYNAERYADPDYRKAILDGQKVSRNRKKGGREGE